MGESQFSFNIFVATACGLRRFHVHSEKWKLWVREKISILFEMIILFKAMAFIP